MSFERDDAIARARLPIDQRVYNRLLRPAALRLFGRQIAGFEGVMVRYQAATDRTQDIDYKPAMCSLIRDTVQPGDHVVDIATGWGVFAVIAARQGALVDTYEAAENMVEWGRDTVHLNRVTDWVNIHHAIVGDGEVLYGDAGQANQVDVAELPKADVLVLDCEGAELDILDGLESFPRSILVETHPGEGATETTVVEMLRGIGYGIVSEGMDRPGKAAVCATQTEQDGFIKVAEGGESP